jgi:hypothetical protein
MRLAVASVGWLFLQLSTASSFGTHSPFGLSSFSSSRGSPLEAAPTSVATTAIVSAENLALLTPRGRQAIENLIQFDQSDGAQLHVYANWPEAGTEDEGKQRLAEQVR